MGLPGRGSRMNATELSYAIGYFTAERESTAEPLVRLSHRSAEGTVVCEKRSCESRRYYQIPRFTPKFGAICTEPPSRIPILYHGPRI